jgi:hypothetical protein
MLANKNIQQSQPTMIASIFCLVYNHENYLRQALDGFLMQKTNFDFEIVVIQFVYLV